MAIKVMPLYAVILRPFVEQRINPEGLKWLMGKINRSSNFDGEIMVLGAMNAADVNHIIRRLEDAGYYGPAQKENADYALAESGHIEQIPSWLTIIDVKFFDERVPDCQAWKLTKSNVYELLDFHLNIHFPTKGYECDWHPYIGKIG